MTEVSLIYYGKNEDVSSHLLNILKVLKVMPAVSGFSGFYITEKKFGFESQRKISLDLKNTGSQDFLIYKYLTAEELALLKTHDAESKYYVLLHKYIDSSYFKDSLQISTDQLFFLADFTRYSDIQSYHHVRKQWPKQNIIKINSHSNDVEKYVQSSSTLHLPVLLLYLLKILVNPVNEFKRYSILLKYSNLRLLSRAIELVLFLDFLFKIIVIKTLKILWYQGVFISGIIKIIVIKFGFLIRHILLMCGFKSFGLFVDTFNFLVRGKDFLVNLLVYQIWHFLFYKVGHIIYYRFIYYVAIDLVYLNSINIYYVTRHAVLMTAYKSYGLLYDITMYTHRITKLYLLYPLRKAYWFSNFQYNKRIKKYFV
ncbi:hypothetical protein K2P97_03270 [bacterium]|nr:hypothetical protein [bacterium]